MDLLQAAFEEDSSPCVGLHGLVVSIEIDHVATAEVGQKVHALVGHRESQRVADTLPRDGSRVAFLVDDFGVGEARIDVSGLFLLRQGHVPKVRHTVARAFHDPDA